jgi:predicted  nucleic acid-binding Zn-ribbon protein
MKILTILIFCLFFTKLTAQVYQGQNLHGGSNGLSYFMFSNQDEKDLEKDLEGYLKNFGKTTKPAKNIIRLEKIKKSDFPEELETIDVIFENNKKIQKISFFFLDKNLEILSSLKLKEGEATDFVEQFKKFTIGKLEIKLAQENVRMVESSLNDAKKDQSKIEKSLESNLKDQEKLGKKLDSSPEMLTKVLSEKEEIVGALYNETEIAADKNAKEELEKASSKKEKEIQKIQKEKAKAETKLSKKETEFDALKDELFQAKAMVKSLESVLKDANTVLINLK